MERYRLGIVLFICLLSMIVFNIQQARSQATNQAFYPLLFNRSIIPTYTPTLTFTPSPTPIPSSTPTPTQTTTQPPQADVGIVPIEEGSTADLGINDEFIEIENQGPDGINLANWTLSDEEGNVFSFPSFFLDADDR